MAARINPAPSLSTPEVVDLRHISSDDLEPVLEEETRTWRDTLEWDFSRSADLVRRFVDLRALNGSALVLQGEVIGYSYYVYEEQKGLVGDLYVRREFRRIEDENRLLENVLNALMTAPQISRIESQLMMIDSSPSRPLPFSRCLSSFDRTFMLLDMKSSPALEPGRVKHRILVERWSGQHQDAAAQLIAAAYVGHIDGRINDQYRSAAGARRFLFNIVQYPGCGNFFRAGSFSAFDAVTGRLCGLSLSSLVAPHTGHITQICVGPAERGTGLGYELLRQSLEALKAFGCRKASLTVTTSNQQAIRLYERMGFRTIRNFSAYVWEGF